MPVPPRENIVRAVFPGVEFRDNGDGGPTLFGHFARFNVWNEIDSIFEGRFLERVAPGAYKKTFRENRDKMKVLFQHGQDPQVGDKPLGPIQDLREDEVGPYYEVPLLEASYVRDDILPGLRAGLYGVSYRFRVMREDIVEEPDPSDYNPLGLPERTIKEASVMEFGPVTFPADAGADAGVRSIGDEFLIGELTGDPQRLREWLYRTVEVEAPEVTEEEQDLALDEESSREEPSDEEEAAPPTDRAGHEATRTHGRRRTRPLRGQLTGGRHAPLYGQLGRKEKP